MVDILTDVKRESVQQFEQENKKEGGDRSPSACQAIYIGDELNSCLVTVKTIFDGGHGTNWIIKDILPESGIVLLSGPPAHFKTWIALDIARSVSLGNSFLGRAVTQKPVFYIDRENPKSVQREYLLKLGVTEECPFLIWPYWIEKEPPSLRISACEDYVALASQGQPLMIFDSLIRFLPKGINENSATDINEIMSVFRKLTKEGASILILHHTGKSLGSNYRGSSDIPGAVDVVFTIKQKEKIDGNRTALQINGIKNRFDPEKNIAIEVISKENTIRLEDADERVRREEEQVEMRNMKNIQTLIRELEGVESPNQSELISSANKRYGLSEHKIRALLENGEGKYWTIVLGGQTKTSKVYRVIEASSSASQDIYSGGKLKSLEDTSNEKTLPFDEHIPDRISEN